MSTALDFTQLIPELQAWNDGKGIDVVSWIRCLGRFDHAVGYSQLFWPEFTIHDECIMFADFTVESYETWMKNRGRRSVEKAVCASKAPPETPGKKLPFALITSDLAPTTH